MATRPSTYLNWTDGSGSKVTQPPSTKQVAGFVGLEPLGAQYVNWLFYTADRWIQYLDASVTVNGTQSTYDLQNCRLLDGGTWQFINSTGVLSWTSAAYLAIPGVPDANNTIAAGSATLADGQVAYVVANVPFTSTGDSVSGSNQLSNVTYAGNAAVGWTITGNGIPASTTITAISGNTVTLSANATATATGQTFTFSTTSGNLTVSVASSASATLPAGALIIARRYGLRCYVGVGAAMMVIRDQERRLLGEDGFTNVIRAVCGQTPPTIGSVVYVSPGASDVGRTAGTIYNATAAAASTAVRAQAAGILLASGSVGNTLSVATSGFVTGIFTSLTPGATYYLDPVTAGAITTTRPSSAGQYVCPIGFAVSTNQLQLAIGVPTQVNATFGIATYSATDETTFAAAVTAANTNGGGTIALQSSFSINSSYSLPANTQLWGQGGQCVLTVASSGAGLVFGNNCTVRDLLMTTSLTTGCTFVTLNGNYALVENSRFTFPVSATVNDQGVTIFGTSNRVVGCSFVNVVGYSAIGINYAAGANNSGQYNVFL